MANWGEITADRTKYPDEMSVQIAGVDVTLGDLRNGFVPKADMTKATQAQAEKFQKQMQEIQTAMQSRESQLQTQLAQAMARRGMNPDNAQEDDLSVYRNDATFGPLVKALDRERQRNDQLQSRVQMDEVSVRTMRYQDELNVMKKEHPELNEQELANYAAKLWQGGPDLRVAKRLMTYDQDVERIKKDAEEAGYKRAKAEPPAPPMPRAGRVSAGSTVAVPKDMKAAAEAALNDPEILQLAQG